MDLNDPARDLLAAVALDAVDGADLADLEAALAARPELAGELDDLREAAGWLGVDAAHDAPAGVTASALGAALGRRPPGRHVAVDAAGGVPEPSDGLAGEAADLDALLASLSPPDWDAPTRADLTVRELVGHLVGVEDHLGSLLGLWPAVVDDEAALDHLAATAPAIAAARSTAPGDLRAAWRSRIDAIVAASRSIDRTTRYRFHHLDLSLRSVLVLRTFELWVHADDIRAAVGRPPSPGHAGRIHAMASLVAGALPLALSLSGAPEPEGPVRLVLTGPGGGAWTPVGGTGAEPAAEPVAEIVADVHDFCRLVGHRLTAAQLGAAIRGDATVADQVLQAARIFAA